MERVSPRSLEQFTYHQGTMERSPRRHRLSRTTSLSERMASWVSASDEYPSRLLDPAPTPSMPEYHIALLMGLTAICLAPRFWAATRLLVVCADATLYLRMARSLESGDFGATLAMHSLNIYPAILVGLHKLGIEWELAGKYWGVFISTAVVWPLFGWLRRQFDVRVAAFSCLLYAVHPQLIQWSPEIVRDPTFWFLMTLAVYLLYRATIEVRPVLFLAGGFTLVLASLTRFEGMFLIVPLVLWSARRWIALEVSRGRLAWGATLGVVVPVLTVVVLQVALSAPGSRGQVFYLAPFRRVQAWLGSDTKFVKVEPHNTATADHADTHLQTDTHSLADTEAEDDILPLAEHHPLTNGQRDTASRSVADTHLLATPADKEARAHGFDGHLLWGFLDTMQSGLNPVLAVLIFAGMWFWRRSWLHWDQQALFYVALAVSGGIWIHMWFSTGASSRYSQSIVIMGLSFASLPLMRILGWLLSWPGQRQFDPRWGIAMSCGFLMLLSGLGMADALTKTHVSRYAQGNLGRWVNRRFGSEMRIAAPRKWSPVLEHYSQGHVVPLPEAWDEDRLAQWLFDQEIDLALLPEEEMPSYETNYLEAIEEAGWTPLDSELPPTSCPAVCVLSRFEDSHHLVRRGFADKTRRK